MNSVCIWASCICYFLFNGVFLTANLFYFFASFKSLTPCKLSSVKISVKKECKRSAKGLITRAYNLLLKLASALGWPSSTSNLLISNCSYKSTKIFLIAFSFLAIFLFEAWQLSFFFTKFWTSKLWSSRLTTRARNRNWF
jgi:hypothetical protein